MKKNFDFFFRQEGQEFIFQTGLTGLTGFTGFFQTGLTGLTGFFQTGLTGLTGFTGFTGFFQTGFTGFFQTGLTGLTGFFQTGLTGLTGFILNINCKLQTSNFKLQTVKNCKLQTSNFKLQNYSQLQTNKLIPSSGGIKKETRWFAPLRCINSDRKSCITFLQSFR